ncbi:MAG: TetR/AcrR family transcriptional regulator [Calditrichaeota bacterium]|nr:MAG: TetR/AcrR family transcriptional regulator [Calditrichota bacterium]MBL1207355.1 TetR/AcrR family transcriptional regulator [Calditrichota bacterium]
MGLTIKNLSQKIGVTEGALYRHFNSKFEILLGILKVFQREAQKSLDETCSTNDTAFTKIENIFLHHLKYFSEKPAVTAVIFSESIFQSDHQLAQEVLNLLKKHEETLSCVIEEGQKNNEIIKTIPKEELVRIIIGTIRYFVTQWRLSHFEFDLNQEGKKILNSIKGLIKK